MAGPQGSGIDTSMRIFSQIVGSLGNEIFSFREYHSNIKGRHSYLIAVIDENKVNHLRFSIDILACLEEDSLATHLFHDDISYDGVLIYNKASKNILIKNIRTMESCLRERIIEKYEKVEDLFEIARKKRVQFVEIDFLKITSHIAKNLNIPLREAMISFNIIALAASLKYLNFDFDSLVNILKQRFGKNEKVFRMNYLAAEETYKYIDENYKNLERRFYLKKVEKKEKRILIDGNAAVAIGKIIGGISFQSYYPITPATDESVFIEANQNLDCVIEKDELIKRIEKGELSNNILNYARLENGYYKIKRGIVVHQSEDEISAIGSAIGAALTGARAATSTSSPGFSLMTEFLGWAGKNEIPVVITHYQRAGPSTGMPTKTEQGDLLFSCFASHGTFPRIVLASGDIEEAFFDAIKIFNLAEKYQMPAIHLLDKIIANSMQTLPYFDLSKVKIERGKILNEEDLKKIEKFKRFVITNDGISPRAFFGTKGAIHPLTGDENDEKGFITEDSYTRSTIMNKRMKKIETLLKEVNEEDKLKIHFNKNAKIAIISFGSTKGVIIDCIKKMNLEEKVKFIQIRLLQPYPVKDVEKALENVEMLIDVEMNYNGQLNLLNRMNCLKTADVVIYKINGRPIFLEELSYYLKKAIEKDFSVFEKDELLGFYKAELKNGV
ncbi:MAG: 2-oxoacid:acceptor oxidoreductase subunit alpha [Candidatus Aenigmarchaeota archaeon]|nr:2-oxoacid:acceptor oxidoreductase subunit alpha [Candidatus Aenigmarchaeota archaeon]MDW8149629.1 2-oxoacid:acceptor oxidoreductase subunit alpha [Candidatus Aenigmarchaeota archaeon]